MSTKRIQATGEKEGEDVTAVRRCTMISSRGRTCLKFSQEAMADTTSIKPPAATWT